jgi:L,D-transpeptidase ErfK/SrfK
MSVSAAGKALAWGLFALHAVARAAVYELPADGSAVFGTDQHIKATYKDTLLGEYKMRLAVGDGTYEIHGTNNPLAVGMAITHGCIRMYPEDVAALFAAVPVGTKVWLINDPVKVAYVDGDLLLEVHPPVDGEGQTVEPNLELLSKQLDRALGHNTAAIHWDFARAALQAASGMPAVVGLEADLDPAPPTAGQ